MSLLFIVKAKSYGGVGLPLLVGRVVVVLAGGVVVLFVLLLATLVPSNKSTLSKNSCGTVPLKIVCVS